MALLGVGFDLYASGGLDNFLALLRDPRIVIEKRTLRYVPPKETENDYEAEKLMLYVRYSKYSYDIDETAYCKNARLFRSSRLDSDARREYEGFLESDQHEILMRTGTMVDQLNIDLIEYVANKFDVSPMFNFDLRNESKNDIYFDPELGQYMIR